MNLNKFCLLRNDSPVIWLLKASFGIKLKCLWFTWDLKSKKLNSVTELLHTYVWIYFFRLRSYESYFLCSEVGFNFHLCKAAYHLCIKYFLWIVKVACLTIFFFFENAKMLAISIHKLTQINSFSVCDKLLKKPPKLLQFILIEIKRI